MEQPADLKLFYAVVIIILTGSVGGILNCLLVDAGFVKPREEDLKLLETIAKYERELPSHLRPH